jgi:hypothetical protein
MKTLDDVACYGTTSRKANDGCRTDDESEFFGCRELCGMALHHMGSCEQSVLVFKSSEKRGYSKYWSSCGYSGSYLFGCYGIDVIGYHYAITAIQAVGWSILAPIRPPSLHPPTEKKFWETFEDSVQSNTAPKKSKYH